MSTNPTKFCAVPNLNGEVREMTIEGYVEYQRREYCKGVKCPVQLELEAQTPGSAEYERIRKIC
jgi:hypothetical protein